MSDRQRPASDIAHLVRSSWDVVKSGFVNAARLPMRVEITDELRKRYNFRIDGERFVGALLIVAAFRSPVCTYTATQTWPRSFLARRQALMQQLKGQHRPMKN